MEDILLPPHLPPKANLQPTTAATLLRMGMLVENHIRKKTIQTLKYLHGKTFQSASSPVEVEMGFFSCPPKLKEASPR